MIDRFLADLVVVFHLGFVLFVCVGGVLALRWPRVLWVHLPAALWGTISAGSAARPATPGVSSRTTSCRCSTRQA
jgi:hypothetical protein